MDWSKKVAVWGNSLAMRQFKTVVSYYTPIWLIFLKFKILIIIFNTRASRPIRRTVATWLLLMSSILPQYWKGQSCQNVFWFNSEPVPDGFRWHFQASVHFTVSSPMKKLQQHKKYRDNFFENAGNWTLGCLNAISEASTMLTKVILILTFWWRIEKMVYKRLSEINFLLASGSSTRMIFFAFPALYYILVAG